jgi:putative FmdB family regulatory protein
VAVYEYRCESCGKQFEVWTMFKEETKCPSCESTQVGRLMSATSFKLKGSGWYATDYKGKSPGAAPVTASDAASDAGETSCGEAGSKPECASCPVADSGA